MQKARSPHWLLTLTALGALPVGCSWTRFDDVSKDAPIVLLKQPDKMKSGFGVSVSAARNSGDQSTRLLVGGAANASRAAAFVLGSAQEPSLDAADTGFCDRDREDSNPCLLASSTAGLGVAQVPGGGPEGQPLPMCFVFGIGETVNGPGLIGRCQDATEYTLKTPTDVQSAFIEPALEVGEAALVLATDKEDSPSIIAGAPDARLAWYYQPRSLTPVSLPAPAADPGYGATVASLRIENDAHILAVGAPDAGNVYLFRHEKDAASASLVGCLGGIPGFGRAMVSGRIDTDQTDELVVSDAENVHVFDGAKLALLGPTVEPACTLVGLPKDALVTSFSCGSSEDVAGCDTAEFGAALEVGDLDNDGDGEVIVGAPGMEVRKEDRAGALIIFDVEADPVGRHLFADILFLSEPEASDQLGRSLAIPHVGGRDIIAAGAPGNNKTALFYCTALGADGPRCK